MSALGQGLIPTQLNVGSPAGTFAVGQSVPLNSVLIPSSATTQPTGTIQFLANGLPIGIPVPVAKSGASISIPFSLAGSDTITAQYSGNNTYAPSTSYQWPITVELNLPTFTLQPASAALTFASGATTGNTDLVTQVSVNGWRGASEVDCTIVPDPANSPSAVLPTCSLPAAISPDGNPANLITIASTAPTTITGSQSSLWKSLTVTGIAYALLLFISPSTRRLRGNLLAVLLFSLGAATLSGCAASPSKVVLPSPETTTLVSSAGKYTISLNGKGFDVTTGDSTLVTTSIPLTIK
jgi:hypothetical protein